MAKIEIYTTPTCPYCHAAKALLNDNVPLDVRNRAWFYLAKVWYQREYLPQAAEIDRSFPLLPVAIGAGAVLTWMVIAGGTNAEIRFAVGECSLGSILVAMSERGVCAILLGDDPDVLLKNADLALYAAKADGRWGKQDFRYEAATDTYRCPAGERLVRFAYRLGVPGATLPTPRGYARSRAWWDGASPV